MMMLMEDDEKYHDHDERCKYSLTPGQHIFPQKNTSQLKTTLWGKQFKSETKLKQLDNTSSEM